MGRRHEAREWAVQFLFQRDFNSGDIEVALQDFWREKKADSKSRQFAEDLIRGVESNLKDLDARIREYAENWDVKRMGAVDRNAMRVALFEMIHRTDIPPIVSINEAVEIAKEFSGAESGKFVNGILDKACRQLNRPARNATKPRPSHDGEQE